jgi:hypothetical protein
MKSQPFKNLPYIPHILKVQKVMRSRKNCSSRLIRNLQYFGLWYQFFVNIH